MLRHLPPPSNSDLPSTGQSKNYIQIQQHFRHHRSLPGRMDLDYTQEWSDLQESMKKPTMTADEEKKHKERKARELKIMLERAEAALEGNRKVFGKRPVKKSWSVNIEKSDWFFRR